MLDFINFTIPPFSFNHIHKILIHFPICLVVLAFAASCVFLKYKNSIFLKQSFYILNFLLFAASLLAVLGGLYSTQALLGKYLTDASWIEENFEFVQMLDFHRLTGFVILGLTLINLLVGLCPDHTLTLNKKISANIILMLILIFLIFFNAHLGGNLEI